MFLTPPYCLDLATGEIASWTKDTLDDLRATRALA